MNYELGVLRTLPRAYFDQAQHMLRYAPLSVGATQRPGEENIVSRSGERLLYFPERTKDKALRILTPPNYRTFYPQDTSSPPHRGGRFIESIQNIPLTTP